MDANFIIGLGAQVMWLVIRLTGPILLFGLVVGVLVSIFQATTQIQEQTLAFVPKIAAVIVALLIFGPWMLSILLSFSQQILGNLNSFIQ
ncbi:flagellar biosynthesis protein FliQ [Alicyclobacillus cycloheptanicus]|uniref:Flagellar biosynthetic protein FliQ n=1 Tax=Alicyclobacillus cycloheptanicus TaxID=1457 RepID=A0ABT9XJQ8_9BACL|nr:flagellar biosynthesis protein FliQ [Alicyclobacillus cycloheptanicus]MDQ0190544.1 flagellar biosynthetic protein FliQ [Alicyclobacillus cycloheptanicus]WDM01386.1 flagellar biosynthesis protein FliQ [Alicyclobacillus cycloheptanicus]